MAESEIRCDACGQMASSNMVVQLGGKTVCVRCKGNVARELAGSASTGSISPEEAAAIRRRISRLNAYSFAFGLPGILLLILSPMIIVGLQVRPHEDTQDIAVIFQILGAAMFFVGLCFHARAKGRNALMGLLGLLGCIGLIVLYFISKQCFHCRMLQSFRASACSTCGAPM